ncbi:MAG: putative Ig domain-containing protein, partial [Bryobacteraceae bacterium]
MRLLGALALGFLLMLFAAVNSSFGQVLTPQPALTVVTASQLPLGTVGAAYSQTLNAVGGVPPYGWSVSAGTLPGGLTLTTDGTASGVAGAAGAFGFTVQVKDSALATATKAFTLTVVAPGTPIITTVAGNGISGYFGDGGPATSASLASPVGVAVDGLGDLYIATGSGCSNSQEPNPAVVAVRKVSPSGIITTVAGSGPCGSSGDGGPATSATLGSPQGVAVDGSGNLYIADTNNNRIRKVSVGGIITTVAGNGSYGYSGDGGPAISAKLYYPTGVAVDGSGNIYIADLENSAIRKVSPSGLITTVAGNGSFGYSGDGGPATSAQLWGVQGVAVDGSGNIYIAESANRRIRKVSSAGIITTVAGNGGYGYSGDGGPATSATLWYPYGVAVDGSGNIYIADSANYALRRVSASGIITTVAGTGAQGYSGDGGPAPSAQLGGPQSVAVDGSGNLYIADAQRVRLVLTGASGPSVVTAPALPQGEVGAMYSQMFSVIGGTPPYTWSVSSGALPAGLTLLSGGTIGGFPATTGTFSFSVSVQDSALATAGKAFSLTVVAAGSIITTAAGTGVPGYSGDGGPATGAKLGGPDGVAVGGGGNLYIADYSNSRVRVVSPGGIITTAAGTGVAGGVGDGGLAVSAQISAPYGVTVDGSGNLYIAQQGAVRKVSPSGIITTVAGNGIPGYSGDGGPATSAQLNTPHGMAVDGSGNLYIADANNHRIRKVSVGGIITTVAGNGGYGYSGDGGSAVTAGLPYPYGVALDGSGNLYVTDLNNNRIRKVSVGGIITTVAGTGTQGFSGDGAVATGAKLSGPQGVAVDGSGNLYIADTMNSRIRKVSSSGIITTVAGNGTFGYSGDGGPATGAQFNHPVGVAVDSSGNLYIADEDNNSVRVILTGAAGLSAAGPSIITASTLPFGSVGAAYQETLSATGGSSPYTWSVVSGALPGGLTLSSGGTISGTPTTPGFYTFALQAADNAASMASLTFTLTITARLSITSSSVLPAATVGTSYSQTLSAAGGTPPYTWSVASGSLPGGLALSSGGTISGMPAAAGAYSFTIQVRDNAAATANAIFALTISPPSGCSYSINPIGVSFTAAGGTAGVTVTAPAGCPWTATSPLSWVAITSGASGTGNSTVAIQVAANSDAARSGSITIAGQSFSISQSGAPCTYSIYPAGQAFPITGGSGNITVNTVTGCPWTTSGLPSWITVTSGASGTGNGTVTYQIAANTGDWRTGNFTLAGSAFVVEQSSATLGSLTTVGSMPHVATAGGWQTSIMLVNLGTA